MDPAALVAAATEVLGTVFPGGQRQGLNETETRRHAIDPIIEVLGYQSLNHVRREARLSVSGQVVDYLLAAGETQVVVEAKSLRVPLGDREAGQLVGYCAQEGIRWALLSNGTHWQIFDTEVRGNWEAKRITEIDLEAAQRDGRLDATLHPLALFARDALTAGDAELSAWSRDERARDCLDDLLADPSSALIRAAVDAMAKRNISIEPAAVVALLRDRTAPSVAPAPSPQPRAVVPAAAPPSQPAPAGGVNYYLFPSSNWKGVTSLDYLRAWLPTGAWIIGPTAQNRLTPQAGDCCCFFASYVGLVATAEIAGPADQRVPKEDWPGPDEWGPGYFRLPLRDIHWLPEPRKIPTDLRQQLDALQPQKTGRRRPGLMDWSVLPLSERDFRLVTGRD